MVGDFAASGRLEIRITPADVGKRVSVRSVLQVVEGHPTFTDSVGVLESWDGGVVRITRRDGITVHIPESSLVAGKVVPPAPVARRRSAPRVTSAALQELASRSWPAPETDRLGDWTLRAAVQDAAEERTAADEAAAAQGAAAQGAAAQGAAGPVRRSGGPRRVGFTRRANSVLAQGDPGMPLDAALERITAWYAERGLPAYIQVADAELDAELERRGWAAEARSLVRTAPLAPIADLPGVEQVVLSREPDDAWLARYHRTGSLGGVAMKVLTGGPSVWFATIPSLGEVPAAIGRCAVDGLWAAFSAVEVDPAFRRQGLASAVMAALAGKALDEGASAAYLQVEEDNEAARALYDGMGFTTHHAYHYRRARLSAAVQDSGIVEGDGTVENGGAADSG